ncbi:tetratricopeptide repeat protein [Haliangium ochraceum]|nr:tetratricopeptide repeat protein [Haliangium ochraceum]
MKTTRTLLLAVLLTAPMPLAAHAQPEQGGDAAADAGQADQNLSPREARQRARQLEREFRRLWDAEEFDEAIPVAEEILRLDPQPANIYNLALLHYNRGDKRQALAAFESYLAADPDDRGLKREAQNFIRILKRDVAFIEEQERESQAELDEARRQAAAAQAQLEAESQARAEAEAARAEAEAERDRLRTQNLGGGGGAGGGSPGMRTLGTSLAVVGGLALGAGVFYALDASAANSEAEGVTQWTVGHDWLVDRAEGYQQRALIFSIAGAGLVAAGATLYYLGERSGDTGAEQDQLSITPALGPDGASVAIHGRF